MAKRLYVGNLSYSVSSSDLEQLFAPHGTVLGAQVIADCNTGRSKGFGFVEMESVEQADAAVSGLRRIRHATPGRRQKPRRVQGQQTLRRPNRTAACRR